MNLVKWFYLFRSLFPYLAYMKKESVLLGWELNETVFMKEYRTVFNSQLSMSFCSGHGTFVPATHNNSIIATRMMMLMAFWSASYLPKASHPPVLARTFHLLCSFFCSFCMYTHTHTHTHTQSSVGYLFKSAYWKHTVYSEDNAMDKIRVSAWVELTFHWETRWS